MSSFVGSIGGILNTGRQGIFVNQIALRVTGQNIANVNTPGYTRQRPIFDPSAFGNGVSVRTIQQLRFRFYDAQLSTEQQSLGSLSVKQEVMSRLEAIFNETSGTGISTAMRDLFQSLHDLSSHPDGTAQREAVRTRAGSLGDVFAAVRGRVEATRRDADLQSKALVTQVNGLTAQIAALNDQITRQTTSAQAPNELIDQRQRLVNELSQIVSIQTFEDGPSLTVMIAGGHPLVEGVNAAELSTREDMANGGMSRILYHLPGGVTADITGRISEGKIGGLLAVRDGDVVEQLRQIDQLAAQLMTRFNLQHRLGTGLDGVSGRDLFSQAPVWSAPGPGSTSNVGQTGSAIVDQSLLTFQDYEVRFTSATTYDLVNTTTGAALATGATYTPGSAIVFDGISITLDNLAGPPLAGDVVRVNSYTGASGSLTLDPAVAGDLRALAAGLSAEPGDNRNALALAGLESALAMGGGTATFANFFEAALTRLGVRSRQVTSDLEAQTLVVDQVQTLVDSLGGVSLDEESVNLIQYERAFQASARVISAVDEMMQTIIAMV
ncbi:MAG: flagellar hook-associated protein FlgK [Candidatus Sumerlaeia bacterium]|nr:flagellar hook-associated protein FlgK [Candidatus Sumerlaeia bacterium]